MKSCLAFAGLTAAVIVCAPLATSPQASAYARTHARELRRDLAEAPPAAKAGRPPAA